MTPNPQAADTGVSAEALAADLRKAAQEIAQAGHAGWGNLCNDAATALLANAAGGGEPVAIGEGFFLSDGTWTGSASRTPGYLRMVEDDEANGCTIRPIYAGAPPPPVGAPQGVSEAEVDVVEGPTRCSNCGKPYADGDDIITEGDEEIYCSQACLDQHSELGCPHEHHNGYRHPAEAQRLIDCENTLRSLASWLGAGGYNAPQVDAKVFEEKIRWGVEQFAATTPSAALATPSPAQAEPTDEELLGNFRVGGHEAPTYWPHGDDRATPGPMSIADIVKVAGIAGLKASQLLAKLKAAGFDVTLNQPLAPDHVAALLVMPLATGAAEGAEPTADAERLDWLANEYVMVVPFDMPTPRGEDADVGWVFSQFHQGEALPREIHREYHDDLRFAIDAARAAQKGATS